MLPEADGRFCGDCGGSVLHIRTLATRSGPILYQCRLQNNANVELMVVMVVSRGPHRHRAYWNARRHWQTVRGACCGMTDSDDWLCRERLHRRRAPHQRSLRRSRVAGAALPALPFGGAQAEWQQTHTTRRHLAETGIHRRSAALHPARDSAATPRDQQLSADSETTRRHPIHRIHRSCTGTP